VRAAAFLDPKHARKEARVEFRILGAANGTEVFKTRALAAPRGADAVWRQCLEAVPLDPPAAYEAASQDSPATEDDETLTKDSRSAHALKEAERAIPYVLRVSLMADDAEVGAGDVPLGPLGAARPRDAVARRVRLLSGHERIGTAHLRLAWTYDPGLHYSPFRTEPESLRSKRANKLCIGLVQARELAVKDRGILRTAAHAAKKVGLLARSRNSERFGRGSSDPCVVFEIIDETGAILHKWRSSVQPETLHPVWHEQWALKLDGSEVRRPKLRITCMDSDLRTKDDFMGRADVDLGQLLDRRLHRQWHHLHTVEGESSNVAGEVELVRFQNLDARREYP